MQVLTSTRKTCLQLLAVSFITLFLELMIIRWVPASIRLIAYYANLMLISSFLGIGLGALLKAKRLSLFKFFPWIMLCDFVFLILCRRILLPGFSDDFRFFQAAPTTINLTVVITIFIFNVLLFVPLGEKIGQLFDALPPLRAYSWDLGGSLLGTILFGLFSLKFFSPLSGLFIVAVLYLLLVPRGTIWKAFIPLVLCLGCIYISSSKNALWSPYYYATIDEIDSAANINIDTVPENIRTMVDPPSYTVKVNRDFLQLHRTINPERFTPGTDKYKTAQIAYSNHSLPYKLRAASPTNVLVVGAGGGNDAEGAILHGAEHVDAVEIDPVLIKLAKKLNASGIYFDPRINIVINDARAFFVKAKPIYDHVIFGYLDSQALFNSKSTIRLDGFVYTVESFRTAYNLLNEDGLLSLSFAAGTDWLTKKLIYMLYEATGKMPVVYTLDGKINPTGGPFNMHVSKGQLKPQPQYGYFKRVFLSPSFHKENKSSLAVDDWPFLYLKDKSIPKDYIFVIATLLVIAFVSLLSVARIQWGKYQTHFFFLGAGFLLLETKNITDCSLYFGTTWFVTMLIIAGILLMVLLANLLAMRLRSFHFYFYIPLIASMVLLYVIPPDLILGFSFLGRLIYVLVMVPLPIFFAGLIFSTTFRESNSASSCFGANLIGATIGGFTEYLSMAIGFQNLSLLVIAAYLASLLFMCLIKRN